ncbi:MAG: HEAT repeat domain-containing protein [Fuerstiella sp.]
MIWPFRPYPPLSLTHKVQLERQFRATAAAIGAFSKDVPSIICPQDLDPVLQQVTEDLLPQTLFEFFAKRFFSTSEPTPAHPSVEWAPISLLNTNGQAQPFQKHLDDEGRISKIQIDSELKQFPYRIASIAALACAECWFRNLDQSQQVTLEKVPFDVLPVFFGTTPILANAALYTDEQLMGTMHQMESSQLGSLSALEHGYLMSMAEYSLGFDYSTVMHLLRPDASKSLKAGLKFLQKTKDTILPKDLRSDANQLQQPPTENELSSRNDTIVLSSLMDLGTTGTCPTQLTPILCRLLGHSEPEIRKWTASTLRSATELNDEQLSDIYASLGDSSTTVRAQAILALKPGFDRDEDVVDRLVDFLSRPERSVVEASVVKLADYADFPDRTPEALLKAIHTLVVKGAADSVFPIALKLLKHFTEDPEGLLKERFADDPTIYSTLFSNTDPSADEFSATDDNE